MIKIAILGYGVVGSGVAEVLQRNQTQIAKKAGKNIEVKYVLDIRDFEGDTTFVKDFAIIENDPEVSIVIESIGGETVAYDYARRALLAGKAVCTPNKALMARHGAELLALAKKQNVPLLFEASVGGGIPLLRPFNDALTTDEIETVSGILNGTCNYILTEMSVKGTSYADALKSAQELGYAEADPTADVGGFDACRKLSILLSLATGKQADYEEILTEGIEKISTADFDFAHALDFTLKHIVTGRICENGAKAIAAPFLVELGHPMATVSDAFNAAWIKPKFTDSVMLYGSGAGKYPTASAVVSNIVDAAVGRYGDFFWTDEEVKILPSADYVFRRVIRISCENPGEFLKAVKSEKSALLPQYPGCAAWLTSPQTEAEAGALLQELAKIPGYKATEQVLRVF